MSRRDAIFSELMARAKIVSAGEAEHCDLVMCVPAETPAVFDDDVLTVCADCGRAIRHRPSAPKIPPKVCVYCAAVRANPN